MPPSNRTIGIQIKAKDLSKAELKKAGDNLVRLARAASRAGEETSKTGNRIAALGMLAGAAIKGPLGVVIPLIAKNISALEPTIARVFRQLVTWCVKSASSVAKLTLSLVGLATRGVASAVKGVLQLGAGLVKLAAQGLVIVIRGVLQLGASLVKLAVQGLAQAATGVLRLGTSLVKLGAIATGAVAVGIASITGLFIAAIIPAVNYAKELDKVNRAFLAIEGEGAPGMLRALQAGAAGMLDNLQLMKNFNDAAMLVNVQMAERLPEALTYLRKLSAATGTDLQYMLESLARGIGRLAPRIIDNLKIVVSMTEATRLAAQMFGVEEDAVSKAQKQIALFEIVMARLKARTKDLPDVLGTVAQKTAVLAAMFKNAQGIIGTLFLPVAHSVLDVGQAIGSAFLRLISTGGGLNTVFMHISATSSVLLDAFGNMIKKAVPAVEKGLNTMAGRFISFAWNAIQWGANISTNLAIGIVRGAATAIIAAINYISNLLTAWMAAASAPRFLPDLYQWGVGAFTEWLRGFTAADFSALESVQAPLQSALRVLLGLGEITEEQVGARFVRASEAMARAMDEFIRTGTYGHSVLEELARAGGQFGDELAELFQRQIALAGGIRAVEAAERRLAQARKAEEKAGKTLTKLAREYNRAFRRGASREELARRYASVRAAYATLENAREETEEAETALDLAKEQLKILREMARAQERLLRQLIAMQEARMLPAEGAGADGDGDGDGVMPGEGEEFPLPGMPDLTPIEAAFADLKERIEAKFRALWEQIKKDWAESGVGQLLEELKTTWEASELKVWWDEFWTDVSEEGAIQAFHNLWDKLVTEIQKYLDEEEPWLGDIWRAFFGEEGFNIQLLWQGIKGGLVKLWTEYLEPGIRGWLTTHAPTLGTIWAAFFDTGIEDGSGKISWRAGLLAIWLALVPVIRDFLDLKAPDLGDIWAAFTEEGFEDGTGGISWDAGLTLLWNKFWDAVQAKAYEWGRSFGQFLVGRLLGGTTEAIDEDDSEDQTTSLGEWLGRLATAIWETVKAFGKGLWDGIVEGFKTGVASASERLREVWDGFWLALIATFKAVFGIASSSSVFYGFGTDVIQGLLDGMWSLASDLWQRGMDLGQKAIDGIKDKFNFDRLKGIGWSFIDAIRQGIHSTSLWDAALAAGKAALAAIRAGLGFQSPYSRPGIQAGQGLMRSVEIGMAQFRNLPRDLLRQYTTGLGPTIAPSFLGAGAGAGFAAPVSPTVVYQITNQFGTDSVRSDADIYQIAEQIQRSLNLRGVRREPF